MELKGYCTLPNVLTLIRLVLSPLFLPLLLVYCLPLNIVWLNVFLAILFVLLSLTDFFDGFFARRYQQVTTLGALLDPIADKSLLYSTLISLLAAHKIFFYWVIVLIGREFFVMGLRMVALENGINCPVSFLGKAKTVAQVVVLMWIIINPCQEQGFFEDGLWWNSIEACFLLITMALSLVSAQQYYNEFIMLYTEKKGDPYSLRDGDDTF